MSYGIIRIDKYKKADIRGLEIHDQRIHQSKSNPDIDRAKSNLNYFLHAPSSTYEKAVSERIEQLESKKKLRANINVMLQALVTSDEDFFKNKTQAEQEEFFKKSYGFLAERYGKENIVSATVHMDEKTPHLHVNFVPVTADGRLSAKEVYSPAECRKLQDDAFTKVFEVYGLQRGEVGEVDERGYSKTKHKKTQEIKSKTLDERLAEVERKEIELETREERLKPNEERIKKEWETVSAERKENLKLKATLDKKIEIADKETKYAKYFVAEVTKEVKKIIKLNKDFENGLIQKDTLSKFGDKPLTKIERRQLNGAKAVRNEIFHIAENALEDFDDEFQ